MIARWMVLTLMFTAGTQAQPTAPVIPEGWSVRLDGTAAHAGHAVAPTTAPNLKGLDFVVMTPGWHITTGPAAILYKPAQKASGTFTLTSEIFLFDPGTRNEAFGVLLGGRHLDTADQAYTYFVIRRSGEFLIRRRSGGTTTDVTPWTTAAAIRTFEQRTTGQQSVRNTLAVQVAPATTTFLVNGTEVARVPTRDIDTDGIVGLRVNHQLNLHVSVLDVTR